VFDGNILAYDSITMNTGADILNGRALALNGAVTLDANTVNTAHGGHSGGVFLQPIPEPSSLGILAFGLVVFCGCRRPCKFVKELAR
jgi:Ice-binding-like/PEP-CTERM motif